MEALRQREPFPQKECLHCGKMFRKRNSLNWQRWEGQRFCSKPCSSQFNGTHNASGTPEYKTWTSIIDRCENPDCDSYLFYGARGIYICKRWREDFSAFLSDMGKKPSRQHSIDRIDNNDGYRPENCRWASIREQSRNKRNNRFLTIEGESLCLTDAAARLGMKPDTLFHRLKRGWTVEKAISASVRGIRAKETRDI